MDKESSDVKVKEEYFEGDNFISCGFHSNVKNENEFISEESISDPLGTVKEEVTEEEVYSSDGEMKEEVSEEALDFSMPEPAIKEDLEEQSACCKMAGNGILAKEPQSVSTGTEDPLKRKRKRCDLCPKRKDRKGNEWCIKCNKCLCGEHKVVICPSCYSHSKNHNL